MIKIDIDYKKYYSLDDYLFIEVNGNFKKRGWLTTEEFFCIIIWKANRSKTKIKDKLLTFGRNLNEVIKDLTQKIYSAKTLEEKLKILLDDYRFRLPMATAILTVLYPDDFTVYDIRVRQQLGLEEINSARKYFLEFLPKVKAETHGENLREKDKYLWGKSFYEDLIKLVRK